MSRQRAMGRLAGMLVAITLGIMGNSVSTVLGKPDGGPVGSVGEESGEMAQVKSMLTTANLQVCLREPERGIISIECADWPGFSLTGLGPALTLNGATSLPESCHAGTDPSAGTAGLEYVLGGEAHMNLRFESLDAGRTGFRMRASFRNLSSTRKTLNDVALLEGASGTEAISFGRRPDRIRCMEQGNYWGKIVTLATAVPAGASDGKAAEPTGSHETSAHVSELVSVVYDRDARMAFLAGFETSERWLGRIAMQVTPSGTISSWRIGFDGGDLEVGPGEEVQLEDVLFLAEPDPWRLLETYAETVQIRHNPAIPPTPPVSWCSWYPYRLGVTEGRVLENARIAAERLRPLGLTVMELDLGWEKGQLPSAFEENEQFPHGLKWLSDELKKLGFDLGVWKAPFTISEFDPLAREHPEWLIQDGAGTPFAYWTWFWAPHGKVYILDLTHPGARDWLQEQVASLAERGVKYLKADFIGCVSHNAAKHRHDKKIVAGGGTESARLGAEIIRKALPDALILNCGGPEMPGTGQWPLLYTCSDTGNTGFLSWQFHRENYLTVACHLFKNRRWGILQPSCLCVGLPGTIEEARVRATAAFLAGGQVDISDTLTTLPKDRWAVLTATLPPLGISAKPVDLFEPVYSQTGYQYAATCKGEETSAAAAECLPGSVWHLHVKRDWDEWELVGVFSFGPDTPAASTPGSPPEISRFVIPFARIGLTCSDVVWGHEFWSQQFLGTVPGKRTNPRGYTHPGDYQDLAVGSETGTLDIAFFGPCVKLLCLRKQRPHPWVVGTTFHQSCGAELESVAWDPASLTLSGELHRPAGESGFIVLTQAGKHVKSCKVDGRTVPVRPGANGACLVPVSVTQTPARWRVRFKD